MKSVGTVNVPQEAFMAVLQTDEDEKKQVSSGAYLNETRTS